MTRRDIHFSAQQILPLCVPKQMVLLETETALLEPDCSRSIPHCKKEEDKERIHHFNKTKTN